METNDNSLAIFGIQLAKYSFIIGTLIAGLYLITSIFEFALFGLFYVLLAFLANFITLLMLLFELVRYKNERSTNLKAILIMLLNIPTTLLYFFIITKCLIL